MEGQRFIGPWTQRRIDEAGAYDLDQLVEVAASACNEGWQVVPADREFNQHRKRDRLPDPSHYDTITGS